MSFSVSGRTFSAIRLPSYRWYWLGLVCTYFAMQIQSAAQAWLAYRLTDSPFLLGLATAAWGIPVLLLSIFGGVFADRLPKRSLLVVSRVVLAMVSLWIAVLLLMDQLEYWNLLVASFFNGVVWAFSMAAMQSIIPELVPRELTQNAVALGSTAWNTSRVAGPALAGVLIGTIGGAGAYFAAVAAYFLGMVFLIIMPAARTLQHAGTQPFYATWWKGCVTCVPAK